MEITRVRGRASSGARSTPTRCVVVIRVPLAELNVSAFPPVPHDWVIKSLRIGPSMAHRRCQLGVTPPLKLKLKPQSLGKNIWIRLSIRHAFMLLYVSGCHVAGSPIRSMKNGPKYKDLISLLNRKQNTRD